MNAACRRYVVVIWEMDEKDEWKSRTKLVWAYSAADATTQVNLELRSDGCRGGHVEKVRPFRPKPRPAP